MVVGEGKERRSGCGDGNGGYGDDKIDHGEIDHDKIDHGEIRYDEIGHGRLARTG